MAVLLSALVIAACGSSTGTPGIKGKPGHVLDEAMLAHRTAASLAAADEDYFRDMDFNIVDGGMRPLTKAEIEGRNMWIVWTGGNDRLWDRLTIDSLGSFDLLKTISSHPPTKAYPTTYGRHNRWYYLGLVNEPCFTEATGPDPKHYGLWIDQRIAACEKDPFADEAKYPGVEIGARGKTVPIGSYYGEPTGIVGLRLFPNPEFNEEARRKWDSDRFYNDPKYFLDPKLVRPYRVGMSCGFCHVGPNPIKPPVDPENPKWENLSSNVGAQYFWWDRIFNWRGTTSEATVGYQLLHVSRPGTLDTSLVSTDSINNPRSMNAVYNLLPRMMEARKWGKETMSGGGLSNRQFNDFVGPDDPLSVFFSWPATTWTPRVLKDGSDSVGALGALNRVYLNIGLFSEEWLLHFRAIVGGVPISPIKIADARKNSVYWQATENQTPAMARFFLARTDPHYLKDAPGGQPLVPTDAAQLRTGKQVFAERCARCHSSKIPPLPDGLDLEGANGPNYLDAWNRYWAWTKTDGFKTSMRDIVLADDFLKGNYLSTELRVPITLLGINACSPVATNAIRDNIWDNFSSESYKQLPSVGSIKVRHPITGAEYDYPLPAGGRGYIRPASLISLWSTAPFLQNNTVGKFNSAPSVEARLDSFEDSIEQMLWPEKRRKDPLFAAMDGPGLGIIDRMTVDSYLEVPEGFIPSYARALLPLARRTFPMFYGNDYSIRVGPFPAGMPVGLLTNIDLNGSELPEEQRKAHQRKLVDLAKHAIREFKQKKDLQLVLPEIADDMLAVSKCKDFVVNKGHYFGTRYFAEEPALSDTDKRALIAFLKTM
jgi:hypothetical protein